MTSYIYIGAEGRVTFAKIVAVADGRKTIYTDNNENTYDVIILCWWLT